MTSRPTRPRPPRGLEDLARELDRLDAQQATHWRRAMAGDVAAAEAVLEIIDRRILLLVEDRTGIRH